MRNAISGWRPYLARGQSLVEFSLVGVLLFVVFLTVVETGRMMLTYASIANASRAAVRYAIVHGSSRNGGAGSSGPSGPANNPAQVVSVAQNFAGAGILTTSRLIVTVTYPNGSNAPGQPVVVSVVYPYDPMTTWIPFQVRLGSLSEGMIVY